MLMKCWKTIVAFLLPLEKKNHSNLTEKHMLKFRERKMFSVLMTLFSMNFSLFPQRWPVREGKTLTVLGDGHTTGFPWSISLVLKAKRTQGEQHLITTTHLVTSIISAHSGEPDASCSPVLKNIKHVHFACTVFKSITGHSAFFEDNILKLKTYVFLLGLPVISSFLCPSSII